MITTRKHVEQHISDVTPSMLDLATLIYDYQTKQNVYLVGSTRGTVNAHGNIEVYRVSYIPGSGFSCTCKSGKNNFWNVKHPSRVCVHCRIGCAHAKELKALWGREVEVTPVNPQIHSPQIHVLMLTACLAGTATIKRITLVPAPAAKRDINLGRPAWMMR